MATSEITNGAGRPVSRFIDPNGKRGPICSLCGDPRDAGPVYVRFGSGSNGQTIGAVCAKAIVAAMAPETINE